MIPLDLYFQPRADSTTKVFNCQLFRTNSYMLTILSPSVTILLVSPSLLYPRMDARTLFSHNAVNLASPPSLLPLPRCFHCGFQNSCYFLNNCSHFVTSFLKNSIFFLSLNEIWLLPKHLFLLSPLPPLQGQIYCIYSHWSENCRSLLILPPCHV